MNGVTADAVALGEQEGDLSNEHHHHQNNEKIGQDGRLREPSYALTPARDAQTRDYLAADDAASQTIEFARLNQRTPSPTSNGPRPDYSANFSPTLRALYPHDRDREGRTSPLINEMGENIPSTSTRHSSKFGTARRSIGAMSHRTNKQSTMPYIPRESAITRTDLIASAERIYTRYLMPGAEKEIYLPNVLRVHDFPISAAALPQTASEPNYDIENDTLARVPDMFHSQKEWVYRAMEQDSFPRFLRSKAFGNLTPISAMLRLVAGLFILWIALSTSFAFIFLDVKPKVKRLWVGRQQAIPIGSFADLSTQIILPFTLAFLFIMSYAYDLDPLLVFWGVSETVSAVYLWSQYPELIGSRSDHLSNPARSGTVCQEASPRQICLVSQL